MSYAQFGYSSPSNYQTNSQQVSISERFFNTTKPITINENIKTACGAYRLRIGLYVNNIWMACYNFKIKITLRKQPNNRYETNIGISYTQLTPQVNLLLISQNLELKSTREVVDHLLSWNNVNV